MEERGAQEDALGDLAELELGCSMLMRGHRMGFGVLLKKALRIMEGMTFGTQRGMQDTRGKLGWGGSSGDCSGHQRSLVTKGSTGKKHPTMEKQLP